MTRLTGTSYAILGLLAIRPWSTYELTKQMGRSIHLVWPRAESNLYQEPRRLVAAGLATADRRLIGQRPRTEYAITPEGREALDAWLAEPAAPTVLESEALIKVLFGDHLPPATLVRQLEVFAEEAETTEQPWRAIAREYIEGGGLFPERLHVNALFWVLMDQWARLRSDWARWAAAQVATWPDGAGPRDRAAVRAMLAAALANEALPEEALPEEALPDEA
ncbi:MAG: PadR family transcriptional regulator [Candidatus Limnocylindrales bacterium]